MNEKYILVPNGDYEARITEVKATNFKTGSKGFNVQYTIRNDVLGQRYGNVIRYDNIVITEKAMWKLKNLLTALGLVDEEGKTNVKPKDLPTVIIDKNLIITIKSEQNTYNGKTEWRNIITNFKPTEYKNVNIEFIENFAIEKEEEIDYEAELTF